MVSEFKEAIKIQEDTWLVRRYGFIEEVVDWDDSIKYTVTAADVGRPPFLHRSFRSKASAEDFYRKLMKETALPNTIERSGE